MEKANLFSLTLIVGSICCIRTVRRTMGGKTNIKPKDDKKVFQIKQVKCQMTTDNPKQWKQSKTTTKFRLVSLQEHWHLRTLVSFSMQSLKTTFTLTLSTDKVHVTLTATHSCIRSKKKAATSQPLQHGECIYSACASLALSTVT